MLLPPAGRHRPPQGVLRPGLRSGGQAVHLLPGPSGVQRAHGGDGGGPLGEGARLVKDHLGDGGEPLQGVPLPHQEAVAGGVADGRHDGGGGGQHQGAGAEHHQNGHRPDDLPGDQPGEEGGGQGDDHDPGGPPVGQPHDLGLARVGGLDQADIALNGAVLSHPDGLHVKGAELIYRAAGHLVPRPLVHRQGLSGHDRLVDGGLSGEDEPVHGDGLPREHPEPVSLPDGVGGDDLLPGLRQPPGGAGREADQPLDARPGPGHGELLQQAPQLHDEGHLPGGKDLPDGHRGDEGDGHQHVGLDVKGRDQADDRLQEDGDAAQEDGCPGRVDGKQGGVDQTDRQGQPGQNQKDNVSLHAAPG